MPHLFEPAKSGRARCRGCAQPIARGELRFGEGVDNPFGEGEATLWFHPLCAAYKRPEPLLATLAQAPADLPGLEGRAALERTARATLAQRRLQRIDGAERAPGGQAMCRHCREPIERGTWRIRIVYFEEGRFTPGGCVHLGCRGAYFEGHPSEEALLHFSAELSAEERAELRRALDSGPQGPAPGI